MVWVNPPAVAGLPQPGRTLVIGVVNVTPDSFSDGGEWFDPANAVRHGLDLLDQGADIIDVGGESTRPGAVRPPLAEELRRVMPVVHELVEAGAVDQRRHHADRCGEPASPPARSWSTTSRAGRPIRRCSPRRRRRAVRLHALARPRRTDAEPRLYADVVSEVVAELRDQIDAAVRAGIDPDQLILDPGSASRRPASTTGSCCTGSTSSTSSAGRCWSVSRARHFSALLAAADGRPAAPERPR